MCETREQVTQPQYSSLIFRSRGARTYAVDGERFVCRGQPRCVPVIYKDVPAEHYTGDGHAAISGEHLSRHGNLDQQARLDSELRIFVDLPSGLWCHDEVVDGVLRYLLPAQGEYPRQRDVPSDLLRQYLPDIVSHHLRLVEEKGNFREPSRSFQV